MYDATIGQFLSEDPISFEGLDANLRRYVQNKSTTLTDPDGLKPPTALAPGAYKTYKVKTGEFRVSAGVLPLVRQAGGGAKAAIDVQIEFHGNGDLRAADIDFIQIVRKLDSNDRPFTNFTPDRLVLKPTVTVWGWHVDLAPENWKGNPKTACYNDWVHPDFQGQRGSWWGHQRQIPAILRDQPGIFVDHALNPVRWQFYTIAFDRSTGRIVGILFWTFKTVPDGNGNWKVDPASIFFEVRDSLPLAFGEATQKFFEEFKVLPPWQIAGLPDGLMPFGKNGPIQF